MLPCHCEAPKEPWQSVFSRKGNYGFLRQSAVLDRNDGRIGILQRASFFAIYKQDAIW